MTKRIKRLTNIITDVFGPIRPRLDAFYRDARGAFSIIWGVSFLGVICSIGASYDMAQFSRAQALAQYTADNMALAGSVAVDMENGNRFINNKSYPYSQIGGVSEDFTKSITGKIDYNASDLDGDLLARATVTGVYRPYFLNMIGITSINFSATTDVAYAQVEIKPASIFLILDNSGSMAWDDNNGDAKIEGLRATVRDFMADLNTLVAGQTPRVLRTSMLNFSTPNISTVSDDEICGWEDGPSVRVEVRVRRRYWDRRRWRYVYYWATGWQWQDGPDVWECRGLVINTRNDAIYDESIVNPHWGVIPDNMIDRIVANGGTDPSDALRQVKTWLNGESGPNGAHDMENDATDPFRFVILMTDGRIESNENPNALSQSQALCTNIKAKSNTFIYTIGYDLRAGQPRLNGFGVTESSGRHGTRPLVISQGSVNAAQAFLASCATDANHNIAAGNASDLNAAFEKIGQRIIEEVIRVKS